MGFDIKLVPSIFVAEVADPMVKVSPWIVFVFKLAMFVFPYK